MVDCLQIMEGIVRACIYKCLSETSLVMADVEGWLLADNEGHPPCMYLVCEADLGSHLVQSVRWLCGYRSGILTTASGLQHVSQMT